MRISTASLALAAALLVSTPAAAEQLSLGSESSSGPRNTLTANPIGLLVGAFNIEYERAASDNMSWFIGPSYFGASASTGVSDWSLSAFGLEGGLRFFFSGRAPEGFFLSPSLAIGVLSLESGNESASAVSFAIGGMGGYTWIFGDVFDLSIGLGVAHQTARAEVGGQTLGVSGITPTLRLSIGPAF